MSPTDTQYGKYGKIAVDAMWAIGLLASDASKSTAESVLRVIAKIAEAFQKMLKGKLTENEVSAMVTSFLDRLRSNDAKIDAEAEKRFGPR